MQLTAVLPTVGSESMREKAESTSYNGIVKLRTVGEVGELQRSMSGIEIETQGEA